MLIAHCARVRTGAQAGTRRTRDCAPLAQVFRGSSAAARQRSCLAANGSVAALRRCASLGSNPRLTTSRTWRVKPPSNLLDVPVARASVPVSARSLTLTHATSGRTTHHAAKNVADARRGKLFAKLCRAISIAAKVDGSDPDSNPRVAAAIALAKKERMPKEKIDRALEPQNDVDEVYAIEGTAAGGAAALLIETTIEPKHRGGLEAGDLRKFIVKQGITLKDIGTLQYLFEEKFVVDISQSEAETIVDPEELAIEVGAEDAVVQPDGVMLICDKAADVQVTVMDALEAAGVEYDEAQVRSMPIVSYPLEGAAADELAAALEALVGHPSISAVTTNVDLTS
eukprot:m.180769 g.180769  ORF g.180769 m.180769 type:complete len:341 (-) comp24567_c0_seq16:219-1241(-)